MAAGGEQTDQERAVASATSFMAERTTEPISLHDLADHCGYSAFHLSRLISTAIGSSPMQYLTSLRFHEAKRRLLTTNESVTDICMSVGFSSAGTFSRRFTESVGPSPSEFRRLPELIADRPPIPLARPGRLRSGGIVNGEVDIARPARAMLGPNPACYIGLFPRPAARGIPEAGAMLTEPGRFRLDGISSGRWWLLATAVSIDPIEQLVPSARTFGYRGPIRIDPGREYSLRVRISPAPDHATPAMVALPWLVLGR